MPVYTWSKTAGANGNADPTINWSEGQPPASVNDSARATLAAVAQYRDDISGALVTSGTSTSYTVTSNSGFDTLAHMDGQLIAFTPHVTNGSGSPSTLLNVDTLGAKPIRSAPSVDIPSGTLIQGTPYVARYSNSDGAFYLHGFFGNPYSIPVGATLDFWGLTAPNSSFVFPFGQAISRATYATLFALINTTYGSGDGSTTFNLPDLRGRSVASPDNMGGGTDPNRLTGGALAGVRNSVGGAGGESGHTLSASEIPAITSNVSVSGSLSGSTSNVVTSVITDNLSGGGSPILKPANTGNSASVTVSGTLTGSATSNNAGGASHNNMQPTILCNRIMRII